MYKYFTSNAGHSSYSPGASGNGYKEHEIARSFNKKLIELFKKEGFSITNSTSDEKTSSLVLQEQVKKCNAVGKEKEQLDISIHLNAAADTKANGVEVLYYDQKSLAAKVSKEISNVSGLKDRGAKERKDLYFLRNTKAPAILIELGFITNQNDIKTIIEKEDMIIKAIFTAITGKKATVAPTTQTTEKLYRVQIGAYKEKKNADELKAKLEKEGYKCIVKYE